MDLNQTISVFAALIAMASAGFALVQAKAAKEQATAAKEQVKEARRQGDIAGKQLGIEQSRRGDEAADRVAAQLTARSAMLTLTATCRSRPGLRPECHAVLANDGAATAEEAVVEFVGPVGGGTAWRWREQPGPVAIAPGGFVRQRLDLANGSAAEMRCVLRWRDGRGPQKLTVSVRLREDGTP